MHLVKSALVAFIAALVAVVPVLILFAIWIFTTLPKPAAGGHANGEFGIDVVSLARSPAFWLVEFVIFVIVFLWRYRHGANP